MMRIGIAKELFLGERRVAIVPGSVGQLKKAGWEVFVETGAGEAAGFSDADYKAAGARVVTNRDQLLECEWLVRIRFAGALPEGVGDDLQGLYKEQTLVGLCDPLSRPQALEPLMEQKVTVFALDLMPRISRAQSMDVLSSMATVAGYHAAIVAASYFPGVFPMLMTAAGTLRAARVFVIGAGVAGLQAIATARRLGAIVSAYDVRPAVKEQVESLGARFIQLPLTVADAEDKTGYAKELEERTLSTERELLTRVLRESDVVISGAAVPGKPAPRLITREMVEQMPCGAVIVDLAAERGGNCELTQPGKVVVHRGVTIVGAVNLAAEHPQSASLMFSRNVTAFLEHLRKVALKDGRLDPSCEDQIVRETLVMHQGKIVHPSLAGFLLQAV